MLDIKWIRDNPDALDRALAARGKPAESARVLALDETRRAAATALDQARERRNNGAAAFARAAAEGRDAGVLRTEMADLKTAIKTLEDQVAAADADLDAALMTLPNPPAPGVPPGRDEADNVELYRVEGHLPEGFEPAEHFVLGEALGMMDFATAAKLAGSRFTVLRGGLARLERALGQYMLDMHVDRHGYTEVQPPLLVNRDALTGTGQLPKFAEDLFFTPHGAADLGLIPTAEVPLTNLVRETILAEDALPLRFAALTPCFRSEAGAAGRDTRGMLRQHQFNKVEMVSVVRPGESEAEHARMLGAAEAVLRGLGLGYRTVALCAGDMGFGARMTCDIEVWLPGQGRYREISSVSDCGDFQARRMGARYRTADGGTAFVHTLNGSGVAVGRALVAVMETYQQADGSILVPEALRPYMGGVGRISRDGA